MATEVSCGQCQGRLLVETLGVVVACPHCGVHLSIPAAAVEPVSTQPPAPVEVPVPAPAPAVPEPSQAIVTPEVPAPAAIVQEPAPPEPVQIAPEPAPPEATAAASMPASPEDPQSSSVFGGPEEQTANFAQFGWHSAPNLFLSPESSAPVPETAISTQPGPLVAPLPSDAVSAEPAATPPAAPATTGQVATFAAFGETSAPAAPAWTFTAPPSTPQPVQFAAAPAEPTQPPVSAPPVPTQMQFTAPTANHVVFAPAPQPAAAPVFAPATAIPPVSAPVPAPQFVFGAAPTPAPAVTPVSAAPQASVLPTTTVAQDAASYAESEESSRQKLLTMVLIIVASYASAVTIVLLYMILFGRASALESLPDLKPRTNKNGDISWDYNPPKNDVAPGHVLYLGQSQRFGNVRVTPVKVTRGRLKFEHYTGQAGNAREPSNPVLKLWVKFENVSRNQTFAPLDSHLLFTRDSQNMGQVIRANGFLAVESNRKSAKLLTYFFDMPVHSEFRVIGQKLGQEVAPGETLQTFIPSEEDAVSLSGDLVWRFQMRKGYNPGSLRGVTTLVDVRFNSRDIADDSST